MLLQDFIILMTSIPLYTPHLLYPFIHWWILMLFPVQFSSVAQSYPTLWDPMEHTSLPCPSLTPGACSNSCPLSRWCHRTISSSVIPLSSYPQCFLASGSFPMSQLFISDGQSISASASASVFPVNIQGWFPLGLPGLNSLQESTRLTRVFSSTTVWKHQFFCSQPSLWSNSHIRTWLLDLCQQSDVSAF